MKMSKKMAAAVLAGVLTLVVLVAGGTYAYFSDSAVSEGNTFVTGTLELDSARNDLPIEGPMFYTNSTPGGMSGTGLWEPNKTVTRTLFVTNTGTLPAKLDRIQAQLVTQGLDPEVEAMYKQDMKIATRYAVNSMRNNYTWLDIDVFLDALKEAQAQFDQELETTLKYVDKASVLARMDEIYDEKLDALSIRDKDHIIHGYQSIGQYMNGYNSSQMNSVQPVPVLQPGDTVAIIYNAWLDDFTNNKDQNILQGQEFDFDFVHTFIQVDEEEPS
ncbi:MAG: TasA family protein [Clostridia bacterium]